VLGVRLLALTTALLAIVSGCSNRSFPPRSSPLTVSVIDARTFTEAASIRTGTGAHGLSLFPQPGRLSRDHTGNYR